MARIYLDNIPNIQVSWLTQGIETGRRGLHFGANDMGSIMIEENVISPAGARHQATEQLLRESILAEGFRPVKRKANYVRLEPEQAVPLAELNHPKVIVLDVMMPGVDGWEVLQRLRQNPTTADIPIIVCTILAQEELALSLGVDDFLRKPVSQQSFLNALNQFTV